VRALALLPDDRTLLSGSDDQSAWLWSIQPKAGIYYQWGFYGDVIRNFIGHSGAILAVAYSPDNRLILTGSEDQTARLWDAQTGHELHQLLGHGGPIRAVAFSPDGQFVLTGSDDHTARLWETETGQEMRKFLGHTAQITQVAFSPDGNNVLTGSADRTARLWDIQTGQQLRQFVGHLSGVMYAGFSSDSRNIITGDTQSAMIWQIKLDDVIAFTCAQLTRDLTPEERAIYNITDDIPTCAKFTAHNVEEELTGTPP
jgi:WD40 repeat protein